MRHPMPVSVSGEVGGGSLLGYVEWTSGAIQDWTAGLRRLLKRMVVSFRIFRRHIPETRQVAASAVCKREIPLAN